jgi:AraC-like DNA-binding protein
MRPRLRLVTLTLKAIGSAANRILADITRPHLPAAYKSPIGAQSNRFDAPTWKDAAEFRSFLGCEIEFGSDVDEVVFPGSVKLMPVVTADPHLNELLIKYCDESLSHREVTRAPLRSSIENAIAQLLPHGKARADEIARRLGMSHRTLACRLSSEGLTFSGILDELKVDLAKSYLRDGDLPISQIAWLLGYREISAFTHAFRRWTGMPPSQLRTHGDLMPVERVGKSRRRVSGR